MQHGRDRPENMAQRRKADDKPAGPPVFLLVERLKAVVVTAKGLVCVCVFSHPTALSVRRPAGKPYHVLHMATFQCHFDVRTPSSGLKHVSIPKERRVMKNSQIGCEYTTK